MKYGSTYCLNDLSFICYKADLLSEINRQKDFFEIWMYQFYGQNSNRTFEEYSQAEFDSLTQEDNIHRNHSKLLKSCNFTDLYDVSQDWNNLKKFKNFTLDQEIDMRGNFVFREKSKRLCKPPFCDKDYSNNQKRCKYKLVLKLLIRFAQKKLPIYIKILKPTKCNYVRSHWANQVCSPLTRVTKVIRQHLTVITTMKNFVWNLYFRLCDLKLVNHLRNELDVKIILLVRDPRSIAASRLEIYKGKGLLE